MNNYTDSIGSTDFSTELSQLFSNKKKCSKVSRAAEIPPLLKNILILSAEDLLLVFFFKLFFQLFLKAAG